MGDRAVVVFKGGWRYSPGIYVHWHGGDIPELLQQAVPHLRIGDEMYAAARFCGVCHEVIAGPLGLGLLEAPTREEAAVAFRNYSHGDAGVAVVDAKSGWVEFHAGYLREAYPNGLKLDLHVQ
jgi:hypothetical protein